MENPKERVNRTRITTATGEDRRAVGDNTERTGLIVENDVGGPDLLVGFGSQEVKPESYSVRLAPGQRFQLLDAQTVPKQEVRINFDGGQGRAFITVFSQ
jgi:hypothetical protein